MRIRVSRVISSLLGIWIEYKERGRGGQLDKNNQDENNNIKLIDHNALLV
jgi:hypothetical protein